MNGGSYDYLYGAELTQREGDIERMGRRLRELGHHDAALRTEEVGFHLRAAANIQAELRDIWHAVEWIDSCDWCKGDEVRPVNDWRNKVQMNAERVDVARRLYELEQEAAKLRALVAGGSK